MPLPNLRQNWFDNEHESFYKKNKDGDRRNDHHPLTKHHPSVKGSAMADNSVDTIRRTFKYRAKINQKTEANCLRWLSICQTLYNLCLEQRILWYRHRRVSASYYSQAKQLPDLKAAFSEFAAVGSQVIQDVVRRVDLAFQAFFRRTKIAGKRAGFPRFKSIRRYDSSDVLGVWGDCCEVSRGSHASMSVLRPCSLP